jgi:uncharacterized protein YcbX
MDKAVVTKNGFQHDRRFMLLKVLTEVPDAEGPKFKNMAVSGFPEMTLFHTDISFPENDPGGEIAVTFQPPTGEEKIIRMPLQPDTSRLKQSDVNLHGSPTKAYQMDAKYNQWFTECFGFPVVIVYLGENLRPVLFPRSPNNQPQKSWLSSITSSIPLLGASENEEETITFADCAPYLVVTEDSLHDVSARLPEGEKMDITKYRPNIVVSGADKAWVEDFWAEIQIGSPDDGIKLPLQHNCIRCVSVNIDYSTGKFGTGKSGKVLQLMQKDRRVDTAKKYSPVFGRYGFLSASGQGKEILLDDEVMVTKKNKERTGFGKLFPKTSTANVTNKNRR